MRVDMHGNAHLFLDFRHEFVRGVRQQKVCHILNADDIRAHIRKGFRKVYEILRRMNGAYGITHRAFANALVFFGAVDCLTQVFDIVQRVENTNDVDAVFD